MSAVILTAELVESFAGVFLSPMYDTAMPTPPFHRECWELYCSTKPLVAIAAPRNHAKSTALTHDFVLAAALFREESHVMVVSSTEELAMAQLGDMSKELHENEDLIAEFGIIGFPTDSKGELVVKCSDGYEFRILARGADQRIRGLKWRGRRPGLIILDDVEEDEQVENADRRRKFGKWVRRALIPMGRIGCRIRWHGTILHVDSMLARLMKSKIWTSRLFKAHNSFSDFSNILWPERFAEQELRDIQALFLEDEDAPGYSQEYLNTPLDSSAAYLKKEWFKPMEEEDFDKPKLICVGVDFAISKQDAANRTSMTVAGKCQDNYLHFIDQRVGRWDSEEIIEEFFELYDQHHPDIFFVESGQIWLSIKATLYKEMARKNKFLNIEAKTPIKDKAARGRAYQKRMKAGACRFDKDTHWYPGFEQENLEFTGVSEATHDDQFDSASIVVLGFESMPEVEDEDFDSEEEIDMRRADPRKLSGRSSVTGY